MISPETTGMEPAMYRELCDHHFKHLKSSKPQDAIEVESEMLVQIPAKQESPRYKLKPEPIPNVMRMGDLGVQSESSRKNLELTIKILKEYPADRLESDIFTLHYLIN